MRKQKIINWMDRNSYLFPCGIMILTPLITICLIGGCQVREAKVGEVSFPEEIKASKAGDTLVQEERGDIVHLVFYHGQKLGPNDKLLIIK